MTRKCHNSTLQTNPRLREEETQSTNSHITSRTQLNYSKQLFLSQRDYLKTKIALSTAKQRGQKHKNTNNGSK